MFKLNIDGKELKVKFNYEATLKTRVLSKLAAIQSGMTNDNLEKVEDFLMFIPELLLVGLQTFYYDEYGFDYETGEGKDKQMKKAYALVEEYCEGEGQTVTALFQGLQEELLNNGFLAEMFKQEVEREKKRQAKKVVAIEN